jgi:hypothetical protein
MMRVDLRDQLARLNVFGQPTTLERPRRTAVLFFSLAAIAAIASLSACYLWFSDGRPIEPDSKVIAAADRSMMVDLRASQQQTATELQRIAQDAAATKADLQKLSDLVSALGAKVDSLQDAAASPTSSIARQPNARAQASTKKQSKPPPN